ncbi:glycosyltransferase family 61 protein [Scytonema millei]|uniref:DUF563 domain-containing protein n=1 Tax=Scytonema millei VB511283 TaxID=1245923 RepID=A0A9X5I3W6_9CYAN|nr:glycosyltransferase family 61 protein [Scytonema millei]NHC33917.1 DUF563 domain-containing protein [Scytonema millei VB511283]
MVSSILKSFKKKILVGRRRQTILLIKRPLRQWIFSQAIEKLGLNLVTRKELLAQRKKYHVQNFSSGESVIIDKPRQGSDEMPKLTESMGSFTLEEPIVFEVENAKLVGPAAVGFDRDGSIISEIITGNLKSLNRLPARTLFLKQLPDFTTPQMNVACSLVNPTSMGYFTWMGNLTRFEGIEYYQAQTGIKPKLIINSHPTKWQRESLRLLGYEPQDCIQWNGSRIKVSRLVVPSYRRVQQLISPSGCRWLRQRLVSNLPGKESEKGDFSSRVYIVRTKKTGRTIINEEEVLSVLTQLGFVGYTLEELSFADQVRLFSQAEMVVAAHGAGLANIMFAENLKVIELFGSYGTAAYFVLSKMLNFDYACLVSDPQGKNQVSERYTDMTVDIAKLKTLLTEMLSSDRQPLVKPIDVQQIDEQKLVDS